MHEPRGSRLFKLFGPTAIFLVVVELVLRGLNVSPSGYFEFILASTDKGLYPPNTTIQNDWGPIPYVTKTNAMGLRGVGLENAPRRSDARIVTIGDSVTDGYFVDNDGTYQYFLQQSLDHAFGETYQVINAARGGGSIHKEFAILREVVLPLHPKIVILTFVTNDISDIRSQSLEDLLQYSLEFHISTPPSLDRVLLNAFTRSAVGETFLRVFWNTFINTKKVQLLQDDAVKTPFSIVQGDQFERNVYIFKKNLDHMDGLVLKESFSKDVQEAIRNYLFVFEKFIDLCRENDIAPLLVYFPAYSQVYDPTVPSQIQDILRARSNRLSVPFLDLTDAFRRYKKHVLHWAPADYHPNARGNKVMADAIFEFLKEQNLVKN